MLSGSSFYRDNRKLVCMGHPDCRRPCRHEPDSSILRAAHLAIKKGLLSEADLRCITLDTQGFPGSVIVGEPGKDPTGAVAKRAKYACERAYAKLGRRLCMLCQMLWAADKPKGPRLDGAKNLKHPREDWKEIRATQGGRSLQIKRRPGTVSFMDHDSSSMI